MNEPNLSFATSRTYRFHPLLAQQIKTTSRLLGCSQSQLVRKLLNEGITELRNRMNGR
jgi:hypothetical protein